MHGREQQHRQAGQKQEEPEDGEKNRSTHHRDNEDPVPMMAHPTRARTYCATDRPAMGDNKVYLGNLLDDCSERDLEKFLKGYGTARNISVKEGCFGFAEVHNCEDAKDAVKDLVSGSRLGCRVRVEQARDSKDRKDWSPPRNCCSGGSPGRRTCYRCVVENLSSRTSWKDLKDYMRKAWEITYTDNHHIRSGEGVVEFGSRSDMGHVLRPGQARRH